MIPSRDPLIEELLEAGIAVENPDGTYALTPSGQVAFRKMVESDPEYYASQFPEWVQMWRVH